MCNRMFFKYFSVGGFFDLGAVLAQQLGIPRKKHLVPALRLSMNLNNYISRRLTINGRTGIISRSFPINFIL